MLARPDPTRPDPGTVEIPLPFPGKGFVGVGSVLGMLKERSSNA